MANISIGEAVDMSFNQFVDMIFKNPPQEPFTWNFSFINNLPNKDQQAQLLGYFIVTGAKNKYDKELANLTEREIGTIREYLLSIGFDIEYEQLKSVKKVRDYHPDNTPYDREIEYSEWKIQFKAADLALSRIHSHNGVAGQ